MIQHGLFDIKEYLRLATGIARMGIWEYDVATDTAFGDETMCSIFGVDGRQPIPASVWFDVIVAAERVRVRAEFDLCIAEHLARTYSYTISVNDQIRYIRSATTPIRDADGTVVKVIGVNLDNSDRVDSERLIANYMRSVQRALTSTITALSIMGELRDPYTAGHELRVADLSVRIAEKMGLAHLTERIDIASRVHDIGKFWVPSEILTHPGPLMSVQYELIKLHPLVGMQILKDVEFPWPVADIVVTHHERLDGSGYPYGLSGPDIGIEARIIAVADVSEAMLSHRPYRPTRTWAETNKALTDARGRQLDSDAVDACIELFTRNGYVLKTIAPTITAISMLMS